MLGFFISRFVFLSFLPVFTIVAPWIVLIIRTSLFSFHITRLSQFCLAMFELISRCYKNCPDRCDVTGLSSCLKVTTLCSLSSVYLHVADKTRYRLTTHSHQHSIFCYFPWIVCRKFQVPPPPMGPWLHQVTVLYFGLYTDLNLCTKYSHTGQILNSCPESCVC